MRACLLLALLAPFLAAQDITVTHAGGSVHMLEGRGGNIGALVGPGGVLLVDDQFDDMVGPIEDALAELTFSPLRYVLNTHYHGDHTGGNAKLGAKATIVAHENVRVRLAGEQTLFGNVNPAAPAVALPVITYNDRMTLHVNGERVELWHRPGAHTDGDSVVIFPDSNVAHLGDLFFAGRFPFVDLEHGGSVRGLSVQVDGLIDQLPEDVAIIPGHGPLSSMDDLRAYGVMLREVLARVERAVAEGHGVEQMMADGLLDDYADWGGGFISTERFLATVAAELETSAAR